MNNSRITLLAEQSIEDDGGLNGRYRYDATRIWLLNEGIYLQIPPTRYELS